MNLTAFLVALVVLTVIGIAAALYVAVSAHWRIDNLERATPTGRHRQRGEL